MLLVLTCAVFLLVVMPALLLWLGRGIEAGTDGRSRIAAARAQRATAQGANDPNHTPWYGRPMQPAFTRYERPAPAMATRPERQIQDSRRQDVATETTTTTAPTAGMTGSAGTKSWLDRPLRPFFGPPLMGRTPPEA